MSVLERVVKLLEEEEKKIQKESKIEAEKTLSPNLDGLLPFFFTFPLALLSLQLMDLIKK